MAFNALQCSVRDFPRQQSLDKNNSNNNNNNFGLRLPPEFR